MAQRNRAGIASARAGNRKEQSFEITDTVSLRSSREESRDSLTTVKCAIRDSDPVTP